MAIDSRAEPEPTGRHSLNGTHGLHGGGGGHGGAPPGSTVAERLTRLEVQVEQNSGVLRHISGVVGRVDNEQDKAFSAIVRIENAISRLEAGLDYTAEKTGKFEIAALQAELAKSKDKIAANAAEAARRSGAITSLVIGLILLLAGGVGTLFWFVLTHR